MNDIANLEGVYDVEFRATGSIDPARKGNIKIDINTEGEVCGQSTGHPQGTGFHGKIRKSDDGYILKVTEVYHEGSWEAAGGPVAELPGTRPRTYQLPSDVFDGNEHDVSTPVGPLTVRVLKLK